jgi:GNAT superfamily N-acetyltransferase
VVVFRSARADDAAAVVGLVDSAYRGDASRAGWTTEADLLGGQRTDRAAVEELIARPRSTLLLALADDELVGCCHLEGRDADTEYLGLYAVRPDRQGGGIGSRVMAEAVHRSVAWGARRLRLTVIAQRADLIAWYLRLGFTPTGETEPFPYGDPRFGIPKRPDLVLTVLERDLD